MSRREQVISSLDQIPRFESEQEEDRFWSSHRFSAELLRQGNAPPGQIAALLRRARDERAARQGDAAERDRPESASAQATTREGEFPEPVKDL